MFFTTKIPTSFEGICPLMKTSFFIVTSPLQLLCAVEAHQYYGVERADLIVKFGGNPTSNNMLRDMLTEYSIWDNVYEISKKHSFWDLYRTLRKISGSRYAFIFNAEYNGWFQNVLISNICYQKRVLYDDGTATLNDYRVYFEPQIASQKKHIEKELLLRLMGVSRFRPERFKVLELFTMYELESLPHVIIVPNKFAASAKYREHIGVDHEAPIGILGQPLVDVGVVSESYYIRCLKALTKEKRALYFAHRGESTESLKSLEKFVDIEVIQDKRPVELSAAKYRVSCMVGFTTTALRTLSLLYPKLDIRFMRIPDDEFGSEKFRLNARSTYLQCEADRVSEYDFK